jgi:hypothetical protein
MLSASFPCSRRASITPRFAPSGWRDIHLAKLFEAAGREAALAQLDKLRSLARPPLA